jgi:hypothetical protein
VADLGGRGYFFFMIFDIFTLVENIFFLPIGTRLSFGRSGGTSPLWSENKNEIRLVMIY